MSNMKDCPKYNTHDDYYTRDSSWKLINDYIPKDKKIWEGCLLNSNEQSKKCLIEMGCKEVIGDKTVDFLDEDWFQDYCDMIITNPPFDKKIKIPILEKLRELDKPFILIMNSMNIFTKYFVKIFGDRMEDIKIIYPTTKLHFDKYDEDGELIEKKDNTSFYSCYVCYKVLEHNVWI